MRIATPRNMMLVAGLWLVPSCGKDAFLCTTDSQCEGGGGQCEANGYCSFPNRDCPSGRHYGEYSEDLAGECVPEGEAPGSSSADDSGASASSTSSSVTSSASSGGTTSAVSDSDASTSESGVDGTGSTGGSSGRCLTGSLVFEEPYDSLPLNPALWNEIALNSATASVEAGQLIIGVDMPQTGGPGSYWHGRTVFSLPSRFFTAVEITAAPFEDYSAEAYLSLFANGWVAYTSVSAGSIRILVIDPDSNFNVLDTMPLDPVEHRWLGITYDAATETATFETSPDAVDWTEFETISVSMLDSDSMQIEAGAGAWAGPVVESDLASLDNFFLCDET